MKILIIRHGDPDYAIDGLTEKGKREAELLADRLCRENITKLYSSPLGRARLTARPTAKRLGIECEILPFMREFNEELVRLPYLDAPEVAWDLLPQYTNTLAGIYSPTEWQNEEHIKSSGVYAKYREVCESFDAILARHGYERYGYNYRALKPNHDTLVFVCHFGVTAVILSHLLNCSPYSLWQHACTLTTSVTTIYTEERREGVAQMRAVGIGDVSHLLSAGEEPSFSARFCECYTDDARHD